MPVDIQKIKSNLGDVKYKFHARPYSSYDCDYNCDPYCRCGTINTVDISFDSDNLPGVTFSGDVERLLLKRYLQKVGDKFVSSPESDEYDCDNNKYTCSNDSFDWSACGGYYGQELDSVTPNFDSYGWGQFFKACDDWNQCASDADRVRLLLKLENGHVLPELETCDFKFTYVSRKKISYDKKIARTKDVATIRTYVCMMSPNYRGMNRFDFKSLGLICRLSADGSCYEVIDGYHRAIALDQIPKLSPGKKVGILVVE